MIKGLGSECDSDPLHGRKSQNTHTTLPLEIFTRPVQAFDHDHAKGSVQLFRQLWVAGQEPLREDLHLRPHFLLAAERANEKEGGQKGALSFGWNGQQTLVGQGSLASC